MLTDEDIRFMRTAFLLGRLTHEQIRLVLEARSNLERVSVERSVRRIVVDRNYLSDEAAAAIEEASEKGPITCGACGARVPLRCIEAASEPRCERCGNPIDAGPARRSGEWASVVALTARSARAGYGEEALVGQSLGGYEVLERIGAGGTGAVYKARQRETGEIVALKVLAPELVSDEEAMQRFTREAQAAERLTHENIVRILSAGEDQGRHYIAMEYVEGKTLADILEERSRLSMEETIKIGKQVAEALCAAFDQQMLHRDIKPENIIVLDDGMLRVSDFGCAKSLTETSKITGTGVCVGTPHYMSPEQIEGETVDCRADIFSLGVTLYRAVTGRPPFQADSLGLILDAVVNQPVEFSEEDGRVPTSLRRVLEKMMAKDPGDRYQTPADVLLALDRLSDGSEADEPKPEGRQPGDEPAEREEPSALGRWVRALAKKIGRGGRTREDENSPEL